jgi:hypothetical protein
MDIKETFLRLTSKTYPHGSESELESFLIDGLEYDEFGNRYIQIGESTCMFTSHLDTATSAKVEVNHVFDGNIIKTDGTSILGADDKAGVTIMFYMIENKVPGLYYFFLGEEVGCVGSKKLSTSISTLPRKSPFDKIDKVISFDRRGYDSVITFQSSGRCCSDEFGQELSNRLNVHGFVYKTDPTGIYTDSAQFTRIYPECTNISVGYKSEHTFSESQDIAHLEELAKACVKIDWETLPVSRDPSKYEYSNSRYSYGGYGYNSSYYWDEDWDEYGWNQKKSITPKIQTDELFFMDDKYNHISGIKINKLTNKLISVDFPDERIEDEKFEIIDLLESLEVSYEKITWDGLKLTVSHSLLAGGHQTECDRDEVAEFIPSFNFWKELIESEYKETSERVF